VKKGWHVYANPKGPGTGLPLMLNIENFEESQISIQYPKAPRFDIPDLDEWVYAWKESFMIDVALRLPLEIPPGTLPVKIKVNGLVCDKACIPVQEELQFNLKIREGGVPPTPSQTQSASQDPHALVYYMMLGICAGVFLNFMPCVLPVLSLKVLSVISLGKNPGL